MVSDFLLEISYASFTDERAFERFVSSFKTIALGRGTFATMVSFADIVASGMSVVNTACLRSILNVGIVDSDNSFDLSKTRIDFANEVLCRWGGNVKLMF